MKRGGSKKKGNLYERVIAKKLSMALTGGQDEYAIWRSSSSGAHSTILNKSGKKSSYTKEHSGDLVSTAPLGVYPYLDNFMDIFFVETKHYKSVSLWPPFTKQLCEFLDQLIREKEESERSIFFVLKANNKPDIVLSEINLLDSYYLFIQYKSIRLYVNLLTEVLDKLSTQHKQ